VDRFASEPAISDDTRPLLRVALVVTRSAGNPWKLELLTRVMSGAMKPCREWVAPAGGLGASLIDSVAQEVSQEVATVLLTTFGAADQLPLG
jgi:hypothetical protein